MADVRRSVRGRRRAVKLAGVVAAAVLATGCLRWEAPVAVPVAVDGDLDVGRLLAGDFDGDGRDDLIGSAYDAGASGNGLSAFILWSEPDGSFTQQDLTLRTWPETVGDFDGDGTDDVVLAGPGSPSLTTPRALYFGGAAGDGRARGLVETDKLVLPNAAGTLAGDYDGDGTVDLAVCTTFMTYYIQCEPRLNDGSATFAPAPQLAAFVGPLNAGGGSFSQMQRDGRDLLFGTAPHPFGGPSRPAPWPGLPSSPGAVGDLDGDGDDDAVVIVAGELVSYRWNGTSAGPFPAGPELTGNGVPFVELLDLNDDGVVDLALSDADGGRYHGGVGDGTFPNPAVGDSPDGPAVFADVTGDGLVEVITVSADGGSIEVHRNLSIRP